MRGCPEHNFPAFARYAAELRRRGHEVFSPAEKGLEALAGADPEIMANSLQFRRDVFALDTEWICSQADVVAMMPGWKRSLGAVAEEALAHAVGLRVVYLEQEDGWHVVV